MQVGNLRYAERNDIPLEQVINPLYNKETDDTIKVEIRSRNCLHPALYIRVQRAGGIYSVPG